MSGRLGGRRRELGEDCDEEDYGLHFECEGLFLMTFNRYVCGEGCLN